MNGWISAFSSARNVARPYYINHYYLLSLLLLAAFMPLGRAGSLDVLRKPERRLRQFPAWCGHLLRFQVGLVDFYAGLALQPGRARRIRQQRVRRRSQRPARHHPTGTQQGVVLPGVGVLFQATDRISLLTGVHQGYSPSRPASPPRPSRSAR